MLKWQLLEWLKLWKVLDLLTIQFKILKGLLKDRLHWRWIWAHIELACRDYRPRGRTGQRRVLVIRIITHPRHPRHQLAMHPLAGLLWRLRFSKPLPELSHLLWWHRLDTGSTVPIIDTPWTQLVGRYFRRSLHGNPG